MSIWKNFEIQCTDYLNDRFGLYAQFIHQGGSNSNISDILVKTKSGRSFYIDAKHSPAQCGQFVLSPNYDKNIFVYSKQNSNKMNIYTKMIMDHMNNHFNKYKNVNTTGKMIDMENGPQIFANWIIETYKEKNVQLFITNNYTILPIEQFLEFFIVSAKYRIKRSGSSSIGKSRISSILNYIKLKNYSITNIRIDKDKIFIRSSGDLNGIRFKLEPYEYMFSNRYSEFEIRKLSNTRNANVIFSIKRNEKEGGLSDNKIINLLKA